MVAGKRDFRWFPPDRFSRFAQIRPRPLGPQSRFLAVRVGAVIRSSQNSGRGFPWLGGAPPSHTPRQIGPPERPPTNNGSRGDSPQPPFTPVVCEVGSDLPCRRCPASDSRANPRRQECGGCHGCRFAGQSPALAGGLLLLNPQHTPGQGSLRASKILWKFELRCLRGPAGPTLRVPKQSSPSSGPRKRGFVLD
jgi:hypothetical protein